MLLPILLVTGLLIILVAPYFLAKMKKGKPVIPELELPQRFSGLIFFSGKNCSHCRAMEPHVRETESTGVPVVRFVTDENPSLAMKAGVMSIPTLMVIRDGVIGKQVVGFQSKDKILQLLRAEGL